MDDGGASRFNCAQVDNVDHALVDRPLLDGYHGNIENCGNGDGYSHLILLVLNHILRPMMTLMLANLPLLVILKVWARHSCRT